MSQEYLNMIYNKYGNILKDYNYVDNIKIIDKFTNGISIKHINKKTGQVSIDGCILLSIREVNKKKYLLLMKLPSKKKYTIAYSNHLIFYCSKTHKLRNWLELFIIPLENNT